MPLNSEGEDRRINEESEGLFKVKCFETVFVLIGRKPLAVSWKPCSVVVNNKNTIYLILLLFTLIFLGPGSAFAITPVGTSIESYTEIYHEYGYASSEVTVVIVEQMYGITMEPVALTASATIGSTYYFSHYIENLGNGTDGVIFNFLVATPESWTFALIKDEGNLGDYEGETTPLDNPLPISEEGLVYFFIAVTISSDAVGGTTGEAKLIATSEVFDGSYYYGANGTIYGGPDTADATDVLSVEAAPYITDIFITREGDGVGDAVKLEWTISGGASAVDIYTVETFTTNEADWTWMTTVDAGTLEHSDANQVGQGTQKWYKIVLAGTALTDDMLTQEVLGKFDMSCRVGDTFTSLPIIPFNTNIRVCIGNQVTPGTGEDGDKNWGYYNGQWYSATFFNILGGIWFYTIHGTVEADHGYMMSIYNSHSAKEVTVVGKISNSERTITLNQGENIFGSSYPVEVDLNSTDLKDELTAGSGETADKMWYLDADGNWYSATLFDLGGGTKIWFSSKLKEFKPGYGYIIEKQAAGQEIWTYEKPY